MTMHVPLAALDGPRLRLEPLREDHAPALFAVSTPDTFAYFPAVKPREWTVAAFTEFVRAMLAEPRRLCFAVVDRASGRVIGSSSYLDIRAEHRGLEIGATWIEPASRGTSVNPEMKYLMLRHAFEQCAAVRVQLKCDARNEHSRRAIAKLGAVFEGVLRKHLVMSDGFVRDTVMFSVIAADWPEVKALLERRLGM